MKTDDFADFFTGFINGKSETKKPKTDQEKLLELLDLEEKLKKIRMEVFRLRKELERWYVNHFTYKL